MRKPMSSMRELVYRLMVFVVCMSYVFIVGSCAWWQSEAKPVVRTIDDLARSMCAQFYSTKNSVSVEDAVRLYCATREAWAPWIDPALRAATEGNSVALGMPQASTSAQPPSAPPRLAPSAVLGPAPAGNPSATQTAPSAAPGASTDPPASGSGQ